MASRRYPCRLAASGVILAVSVLASAASGAAVGGSRLALSPRVGGTDVSYPSMQEWGSSVAPTSAAPHASGSLSANWAGFIEPGSTDTLRSVHGAWTVPSVSGSATTSQTGYSASWIGIGGATTRDLDEGVVQIGTNQNVLGGVASYGAWYESSTSTTGAVTLGEPVGPGDLMTASVSEISYQSWDVTISDASRGWTKTVTTSYTGTNHSAEWIEERPKVGTSKATATLAPLANFGSVSFTSMEVASQKTDSSTKYPAFIEKSAHSPVVAYPWSSSLGLTAPATVTYGTPTPRVDSVSPNHGAAGATVRITGTWLLLVTAVHFQYAAATTFLRNDTGNVTIAVNGATAIDARVPANALGATVNVVVITVDGSTALAAGDAFTYGTPTPSGYDLVGSDGGVFVFPPAGSSSGFYGSLPALKVTPNAPVVGMVPTKMDNGYFLVAADGGVFSFGTAPFLGSLPAMGVVPRAPITGIVAANTDKGYFLVGKDGGVFAFGTVPYLGSLPGSGVSIDDIIGIASTPTGNGYWLVSQTGTVYAYGVAQLGTATVSPVASIAGTPTGGGYWITTAKGAVQAFGKATDYSTLPLSSVVPALAVVAIVPTIGTGGYWLIGSDGGIFNFGDASYVGSLPGDGVHVDNIVGAVPIA